MAAVQAGLGNIIQCIHANDRMPLTEKEISIDLNAVKNAFVATGNHLFDFVMAYEFPREVAFEERVTIFCQLIAIYEEQFEIREEYQKQAHIEYVMVFPK